MMRIYLASFGIALCVALGACSAVVDWDPEGQPCESGKCAQGYSCLGSKCVGDGSIPGGQACSADSQCKTELRCLGFVCRKGCSSFYKPTGDCEGGEFCNPFSDGAGKYIGGCNASECLINADCAAGDTCVQLGTVSHACLKACEITFQGTTYLDTCGATSGLRYCQPIGPTTKEQTICLETRQTAEPVGAVCSPVDKPCQRGLGCAVTSGTTGQCRRYCDPATLNGNSLCGSSELCCNKTLVDGKSIGFCATSCSDI